MYSKVLSGTLHGVEGRLITVEADVSDGLPVFNMVGVLASEVREAGDRVRTALRNSGYILPPKKITVNLSPADVRKEGAVFDLPISIALLAAYGYIPAECLEGLLIIGELSLNGQLRPVKGILPIADYARRNGFAGIILPYGNRREAAVIPGMRIYGAENLKQVVDHLNDSKRIEEVPCIQPEFGEKKNFSVDFSEVMGQMLLKRAVEIAVAGMHNILFMGPPGAGKSMIAKRIPTIMPRLSYEESIELTKIYSVSGLLEADSALITERPFRMPHHSVTSQALIGGGRVPKPGEISLAHHGVLFLDEFLEFPKNVIEMLRQPLENGSITISRLHGSYVYPCEFMLVAAMNPCPCGYYPDKERCRCTRPERERYLKKLSAPLLDRIDMNISVKRIQYGELYGKRQEESSAVIGERVAEALARQRRRLKPFGISFNSKIPSNILEELCGLGAEEQQLWKEVFEKYDLSARGAARILRVSRTIADLEGSERVHSGHILEALSYRMPGFSLGGEEE